MSAGGIAIILIVVAAGGALFINLMVRLAVEAGDLNDRLAHQRALAEFEYGDVVELPAAAKINAGGRRTIRSDRLAHDPMSLTHRGSSR